MGGGGGVGVGSIVHSRAIVQKRPNFLTVSVHV